jgi:hypothetical protein
MFSKISSLIAIIKAVIDLVKYFKNWLDEEREKEALKKRQARESAVNDSKKAESEDEIWDSQERVTDNKP